MTKKDYILIAEAIKQIRDIYKVKLNTNKLSAINEVIFSLENKLSEQNPLFNKEKFLQACGVTE